jgi:hypothetical protein
MTPTLEVRSYVVFNNHIQVSSVEEHLTTQDNGVEQESKLGPITINQWLQNWNMQKCKIFKLNYGH